MGADMIEVIDCKYANEAKPEKKFGSIVDVSGDRLVCPAGLVSEFHPGQRYNVEIREETWNDGPVRIISRILPNAVSAEASGAVPTNDAELRFVLALAAAYIQSGRAVGLDHINMVDASENLAGLVPLIEKLRAVYAETFGGAS
jgi:hypothetical protein